MRWTKGFAVTVALVLGGTILFHSSFVREQLPWLVAMQLWVHRVVTSATPRSRDVKVVTPVEIDDGAFWNGPPSGRTPTNRRYLADLIQKAADRGAAVVALDFRLTTATNELKDVPAYATENAYLLATIENVSATTPVVLTTFLVAERGEWRRAPNIFTDGALPPNVTVGHLNMPDDLRHIALAMPARDETTHELKSIPSFAERIVAAYESAAHLHTRTSLKSRIMLATRNHEFVYGDFITLETFRNDAVTSTELLTAGNVACCRNRVVLIGGTWHEYGPNTGPFIDRFSSPAGELPGMYMHANYVEALLDDRFSVELPTGLAIIADIFLGLALYSSYHKKRRFAIIGLCAIPFVFGYVLVANLGIFADAVLPFSLCFVHLLVEHELHRRSSSSAVEFTRALNAGGSS